jgi:hypothetical protein
LYPEPRRSVVIAVVLLAARTTDLLGSEYKQHNIKNYRSPRLWIQAKQQYELLIS